VLIPVSIHSNAYIFLNTFVEPCTICYLFVFIILHMHCFVTMEAIVYLFYLYSLMQPSLKWPVQAIYFRTLLNLGHSKISLLIMLRSQIKLTSYDFIDLHITGEFDNRPGTGRFLRIFFCVVTYPTGAGRRLFMKTSADADVVRCPAGVVRDQPDTVPGRFYTNFHVQWWIYVYQNSPSYLQRNSLLK